MISPKEISEKKFEKAARGYRIEEVDTFLREVAFSVAKIIKSYDESESKIEKLVEKVNEYREDEDAIKVAILGAQKQGKQVLLDAELEAERTINEAKEKAEHILENTKNEYNDQLLKLENLKKEVTAFKAQLTQLYNRQLHLIMEIPEFNAEEVENIELDMKIEEPITENVEEYNSEDINTDETSISDYNTDEENEPENTYSFLDDSTSTANIGKFSDLRFGNNQIK